MALVGVRVELRNDDGDYMELVKWGDDVDDAVDIAERAMRDTTGDDSWTMDDWRAI